MIFLSEFSWTDSGILIFLLGLLVAFIKGYVKLKSDFELAKNGIQDNKREIAENKSLIRLNSENDRKDYEHLRSDVNEVRERSDSNDKEQRIEIQRNRERIVRLETINDCKNDKF